MDGEAGDRLTRLEQNVRSLKRCVFALGAAFVAAVSLAAAEDPQELTLRKLTLVDRDGNMRIQSSGGSVWEFWDAEGNLRSLMGVPTGAVAISLFDAKGNERIAMVARDQGSAEIRQRGPKGKTRIHQVTGRDGDASIALTDEGGKEVWSKTSRQ